MLRTQINPGDEIIYTPEDTIERKRFKVIGEAKTFYVCRDKDDKYTECFLKTDPGVTKIERRN